MSLRIAFMGSPDFSVPTLEAIIAAGHEVACVYSQPPRPAGRGKQLTKTAVHEAADRHGIEVRTPVNFKAAEDREAFAALKLDTAVVVAYGLLLPKAVLDAPRLGCFNIHGSILPRWRGAAPIQRAVLAGDRDTGVAIMQMEEGLDTGPVHRVRVVAIDPLETSGELFERLAPIGGELLAEVLRELPRLPPPTVQDEAGVTLAPMLSKAEGLTRWTCPVRQVVDHVRGMDPWPGAFTGRGGQVLKIFRAAPSSRARPEDAAAGQVIAVDRAGMHVACGEGVVCVAELQVVGGKRMPAQAYAAGKPFAAGERLVDPPTPAE